MCDVDDQAGIVVPSGGSGAKARSVKKIDITELTPNARALTAWPGSPGRGKAHPLSLLSPPGTAKDGTEHPVILDGRLTAMDDPEVRQLAAKYGDPDEILKEDWIPQIPGITCSGSYEEYAGDPGRWIYAGNA